MNKEKIQMIYNDSELHYLPFICVINMYNAIVMNK